MRPWLYYSRLHCSIAYCSIYCWSGRPWLRAGGFAARCGGGKARVRISLSLSIYIYTHIYIERERELHLCIYVIYIYIYMYIHIIIITIVTAILTTVMLAGKPGRAPLPWRRPPLPGP